jgi:hypothetical protein
LKLDKILDVNVRKPVSHSAKASFFFYSNRSDTRHILIAVHKLFDQVVYLELLSDEVFSYGCFADLKYIDFNSSLVIHFFSKK